VNNLVGETAEDLAVSCGALGFDKREFIFALNVFEELGLVAFKDGKLIVYRGVKADLNSSETYKKVCALQEA
jgi:ssDNA-specific exonuclease RecJ